jgi:hypothetical protein
MKPIDMRTARIINRSYESALRHGFVVDRFEIVFDPVKNHSKQILIYDEKESEEIKNALKAAIKPMREPGEEG